MLVLALCLVVYIYDIFERPLQVTVRLTLSDRCLSRPSSPVCLYCRQTVGWIKMPPGTERR